MPEIARRNFIIEVGMETKLQMVSGALDAAFNGSYDVLEIDRIAKDFINHLEGVHKWRICRPLKAKRRSTSGNKRMARGLSPHERGVVMGHEIRPDAPAKFTNTGDGTGD